MPKPAIWDRMKKYVGTTNKRANLKNLKKVKKQFINDQETMEYWSRHSYKKSINFINKHIDDLAEKVNKLDKMQQKRAATMAKQIQMDKEFADKIRTKARDIKKLKKYKEDLKSLPGYKRSNELIDKYIAQIRQQRKLTKGIAHPHGIQNESIKEFVDRVFKGPTVSAGSYFVSFTLVLFRDGRLFTELVSKQRANVGQGGMNKCVTNIIHQTIKKMGFSGIAYSSLVNIIDFHARRAPPPIPLRDVPLRGLNHLPLAYKFLGDLNIINKNQGQCVLDYIIYETSQCPRFKNINRQMLIEHFGDDCEKKGISTSRIIKWARESRYIRVIALDPFLETLERHDPEIPSDAKLNLVFIVNNEHLYPLLIKHIRKTSLVEVAFNLTKSSTTLSLTILASGSAPTLAKTMMRSYRRLVEGTYCNDKKVILIDDDKHITKLCHDVVEHTNMLIVNVKPNHGTIVMFEHPVSGQVYITAAELKKRKEIATKMHSKIAIDKLTFRNQSFTRMAHTWFEAKYGTLRKSTYSKELRQIFEDYSLPAYIRKYKNVKRDERVYSIDTRRCYTSILIDNQAVYNEFSAFDEIKPYSSHAITCGEFYINRKFHMHSLIELSHGWYPAVFVKYCLDHKYIVEDDIKYQILPSKVLPHDTFAEFAKEIVAEYPNQSKDLLNSFIGELNKKQATIERGCTTDSFDVASSLVLDYPDVSVVKVGELWFIRDSCGTPMSSGNVPIYRHIIASGYIKLDHMLHQTLKPDTRVIAINTDSVKVQGDHASGIRSKDDVAIGEYGYENSTSTIIGKNEIVERPKYKFSKYPKVEMIEPDQIGESSCMILGQAGTGKSYLLTNMATKDDITLCYTNKACNNLRDKGVPNVFTFDMYFNEHLDNASYVKRLNKYKKIMVDELSMTPSRFFIILSQLGAEGSESEPHQILLFGDMNQCKPVESSGVWYDYSHSQFINALTNYKRVELQYVEGKSRYDRRLFAALNNFLNTGSSQGLYDQAPQGSDTGN